MTTKLRTLLALASILCTFTLFGCTAPDGVEPTDGNVIDTTDGSTDDNQEYGTAIFTVDESLPPVEVELTSVDGSRNIVTCTTTCMLNTIEVGTYDVTAVLEGALFPPTRISVVAGETCAHTFVGGWAPQGTYMKYDNPEGTGEPLSTTEYEVTTTLEPLWDSNVVTHLRIVGIGDYEVEGDTFYLEEDEAGTIAANHSWIKPDSTSWWLVLKP